MPKPPPPVMLPGTVYDAALNRMRWLWDEFDGNVSVNTSSGKDSVVVMELALRVAREKNTLPLKVLFLDQEAEWQATEDYIVGLLDRPEIDLRWYQIPFRLQNAVNHDDQWLRCWDEATPDAWLRPKHPAAITENPFDTDRFHEVLWAMSDAEGGATLTGVRSEESPARRLGATSYATYKWATWGHRHGRNHIAFHPIYDWALGDVWKAIYDGDDPDHPGTASWAYNRIYDYQHQYGVPDRAMRVSSLHHESAVKSLFMLQELEPETYGKLTSRLNGISTANHFGVADFIPKELPFMFASWVEYFLYLVEHLVVEETDRETFRAQASRLYRWLPYVDPELIAREGVRWVMLNDVHFVKGQMFFVNKRDPDAQVAWEHAHPEGQGRDPFQVPAA